MNNKKTGGINIGTSSILVIFVLLAMVSFAALSYMSARSDYTLSKEAADRTASYYDANRMAELYMANIEALLSKHLERCSDEEEYYGGISRLFDDNDNINVSESDGNIILSYKVAVTEGQNLEVSLRANYPKDEDDNLFYVDKWATCVNQEWLKEAQSEDGSNSGVKLLFN